jgi:thioredoxin 1
MPVFDTPITTDDRNLNKVLAQNVPVIVYLYDSRQGPNKTLENALKEIASKHVGELLVTRVDVSSNLATHRQYGNPRTPALITLGTPDHAMKSKAEAITSQDLRAHVDYLLGKGPKPVQQKADSGQTKTAQSGAAHLTDATFEREVLRSSIPVFVDFWAPWCGPCHTVAPLIDQLAGEYAGRVKIVKLNTDENPVTMQRFQVMSIPTFITFRDGKQVGRRSGASPQYIRELIQQVQS